MNSYQSLSNVELGDRHRRYLALALLSVGLKYTTSAAMDLAAPELLSMLGIVVLSTVFLFSSRGSDEEERDCLDA